MVEPVNLIVDSTETVVNLLVVVLLNSLYQEKRSLLEREEDLLRIGSWICKEGVLSEETKRLEGHVVDGSYIRESYVDGDGTSEGDCGGCDVNGGEWVWDSRGGSRLVSPGETERESCVNHESHITEWLICLLSNKLYQTDLGVGWE